MLTSFSKKQYGSKSAGFWWSQLIRIHTVFIHMNLLYWLWNCVTRLAKNYHHSSYCVNNTKSTQCVLILGWIWYVFYSEWVGVTFWFVCLFEFNIPPTAKVIWRLDHSLKYAYICLSPHTRALIKYSFGLVWFYTSQSTAVVMSGQSVHLTTHFSWPRQ